MYSGSGQMYLLALQYTHHVLMSMHVLQTLCNNPDAEWQLLKTKQHEVHPYPVNCTFHSS